MWLPDDRWTTAMAYLQGASDADPAEPLRGFSEWVKSQLGKTESSYIWWSILLQNLTGEDSGGPGWLDLSDDQNAEMLRLMYELMLTYLNLPAQVRDNGPVT
jgi:hypothetical protein